jgi:dolichol-phosphate mannosyltransferase
MTTVMNKALIIIPAYNEERNIVSLVNSIHEVMIGCKILYKIVVVNDGSVDSTGNIILQLSKKYPIDIVTHKVNEGIGQVFLSGLKRSVDIAGDRDVIIIIEADCTNEPSVMPGMFKKINEGYDVVVGSRYCRKGKYYNFPIGRYILSKGANSLLKSLFFIRGIKDYTIFFRDYKASILKRAFLEYGNNFIKTNTFVANAEILIKLNRIGIKATEVPLVYNYGLKKGKSGMKIIKTLKEYLIFIFNELKNRKG